MTTMGSAKVAFGGLATAVLTRVVPAKRQQRRRLREAAEDQELDAFLVALRGVALRESQGVAPTVVAAK
jgi:hypothetical protein